MSDSKNKAKAVGKVMVNTLGFLSLLVGSTIILGVTLKILGGIFVFSTKALSGAKRSEGDTNNGPSEKRSREPDGEAIGPPT